MDYKLMQYPAVKSLMPWLRSTLERQTSHTTQTNNNHNKNCWNASGGGKTLTPPKQPAVSAEGGVTVYVTQVRSAGSHLWEVRWESAEIPISLWIKGKVTLECNLCAVWYICQSTWIQLLDNITLSLSLLCCFWCCSLRLQAFITIS